MNDDRVLNKEEEEEELEETKENLYQQRSLKHGEEDKSILNDCHDSAFAANYETKALANTFARKCKKIQQLDQNFNNLKLQISRAILHHDKNCTTSAKNFDNQKPHAIFAQISKLFGDCDDLSREKINVAKSLYDDVDVEIQKLDDILHNLENCNSFSASTSNLFGQLESNTNNSTICDKKYSNHLDNDLEIFGGETLESTNTNLIDSKDEAENRTTLLVDNEEDHQNFASSRLVSGKDEHTQQVALNNSKASSSTTAEVNNSNQDAKLLNFYNLTSEMPVDENEPRYCICNQVSYGHMIGCDNPECRIEWFHFTCVNITRKPRGTWLCPECTKASDS